MSKNQNRLITTQRVSIGNRVLKGIGGSLLLSMLIFGALNVNEQAGVEDVASNQSLLSENSESTSATTLAAQESAALAETEAVEATETVAAVETVESSATALRIAGKNSTASVTGVAGVAKVESTTSAVQFAAVQSSLNAAGTAGVVSWSTLMEQNSKSFAIERSLDGDHFEKLGEVEAQGGKGVQQAKHSYQFEDKTLGMTQMPRVFYRVKQIGLDGKTHLTDIVEHDLGLDLGLYAAIINEKGVKEKLDIRYAGDQEGKTTLRIFKPSGEVMVEQALQTGFTPKNVSVETAGWDKGTYFLQLANENTSLMEQFSLR